MNLIKTTTSLCASCLEKVPARVVERDGAVHLERTCPRHGAGSALLASDSRLYWNAGGSGAGCCSLGHSCTLIFEITERCNLACPACFAGASPHGAWQMSFDDFAAKLDRLVGAGRGDADMVQFSGGEPTLHPDLERMIAHSFECGIRKVYVNTNGLRLAGEADLARRFAALDAGRDRLQFYLQFDGFEDRAHQHLRGAKGLAALKQRAAAHLIEAGLYVLPVMTVARGVNLDGVGEVIEHVRQNHPRMNTVILQPAFYAGRWDAPRPAERLTTADLAHAVARQTGLFAVEDFGPIPCSHPSCFALAVAVVRGGKVIPVSRYFPRFETWREPEIAPLVSRFSDRMPQHMLDLLVENDTLDALLDLMTRDDESFDWSDHENFLLIGIKPFMDAETYDQDRVDRCCVHVVDRAGEPVSLCEYNTLRRPRGVL